MNRFSIAVPFRTNYYENFARVLSNADALRSCIMWTRRPMPETSSENNRLCPLLGLLAYAGAISLPPYYSEAFRFALYPAFDRWAKSQLKAGDHVISSYAYANECFRWVRRNGGKAFLDGGNSHPENFWQILEEEHRRWKCPYPPVPRFYIERAKRMMEDVDFVISPSEFVTKSFLARGFSNDQIIPVVYPQDLSVFKPVQKPRPLERPFTIINTGSLSLRKGTPYLLEAVRIIRTQVPDVRLLLTQAISDSIKPILEKYADLPIEWAPYLPPEALAERLRSADLYVLPSLEEGLVRTALEAMACGLPVILTHNTGASDFVTEGINGSIVAIRDAQAIADAALAWHGKNDGQPHSTAEFRSLISTERSERMLLEGLRKRGFLEGQTKSDSLVK